MNVHDFTYQNLARYLSQGKNANYRKIGHNTIAHYSADCIAIRFHDTIIAIIDKQDTITLYNGGFYTFTTKERLNEILAGSPFRVYQERGIWYLWDSAKQIQWLYQNGITIYSDNSIANYGAPNDQKETSKLRKQVNSYCKTYVTALFNKEVDKPSNRDCFYCVMREVKSGKPLGETIKDKDHIISHLEENYFVPSMLYNALESFPVSLVAYWTIGAIWYPDNGNDDNPQKTIDTFKDIASEQILKSLRKYIFSQLELAR